MTYISARTGSILGLENLNTIINIVSSEMSWRARVVSRPVDWFALRAS